MATMEDGSTSGSTLNMTPEMLTSTGNQTAQHLTGITAHGHWIASIIASIVIILVNLWIVIAFVHYARTSNVMRRASKRDMDGGMVWKFAMAAAISPFFRYVPTLAVTLQGLKRTENGCEIAADMSVVGYIVAIAPLYGYLWSRQRTFYSHPSLGHMFGKCVSIFSTASLVMISLMVIAVVAVGVYPSEYEWTPEGCALIGLVEAEDLQYRTYLYGVTAIVSQLILLGLFIYPLYVHCQKQKGFRPGEVVVSVSHSEYSSDASETQTHSTATHADKSRASLDMGTMHSAATKPTISTEETTTVPDNRRVTEMTKSQPATDHVTTQRTTSFSTTGAEVDHGKKPTGGAQSTTNDDEPERKPSGSNQSPIADNMTANDVHSAPSGTFGKLKYKSSKRAKRSIFKGGRKRRKSSKRTKNLYALIKRTLYLALIAIGSDLAANILVGLLIPDTTPQEITFVVYDANLLVNVMTVVASYKSWRNIMQSPCKKICSKS